MKIPLAMAELHEAENDLASEYRKVADKHRVEHDVFHMCHKLAKQCEEHVELIAKEAQRYDEKLGSPDRGVVETILAPLRRKTSEALGQLPPAGVLLLRDLRRLFLMAEEVEISWVILGQGAQAARDEQLLNLVGKCHEQSVIQCQWLKTRIKQAAPQVLMG